tara:strand:+ start:1880 stop:2287 length:408 start_codon:yes stop_codon:yes gene_type:complete
MKNFDHYSGMSPETIHNLSMKIKDLSREYSLIIEFIRGLSSYLKSVDLLNKELGAHERLFQIIDKDEVLNIHLKKSIMATQVLKKWVDEIGGISNAEINLSFEKLDSILWESIKLMENKFQLENTFNKNQSTNNN